MRCPAGSAARDRPRPAGSSGGEEMSDRQTAPQIVRPNHAEREPGECAPGRTPAFSAARYRSNGLEGVRVTGSSRVGECPEGI